MKGTISLLAIILPALIFGQDQQSSFRVGGGYAHDFPGLNGFGGFVEYTRPLTDRLQAACAAKWSNLNGFPRTTEIKEFTRAASLDFNLYFLPIADERQQMRIGAGYSFSFYNIRRSFPITANGGSGAELQWQIDDKKGRVSGPSLIGEYEFYIPNSNFSIGVRGSVYKAYDYVWFAGGFVGIRI